MARLTPSLARGLALVAWDRRLFSLCERHELIAPTSKLATAVKLVLVDGAETENVAEARAARMLDPATAGGVGEGSFKQRISDR